MRNCQIAVEIVMVLLVDYWSLLSMCVEHQNRRAGDRQTPEVSNSVKLPAQGMTCARRLNFPEQLFLPFSSRHSPQ